MVLHLTSNGPTDLALSNQPVTEHLWDRGATAGGVIYRASRIGGVAVIIGAHSVAEDTIEFTLTPAASGPLPPKETLIAALRRKFSLDLDLPTFYRFAAGHHQLMQLSEYQAGLRPILKDSLLEALCLAITDQQVNVAFADKLKRRLLENYGKNYQHQGQNVWLFPTADVLAALDIHALRALEFTRNKSRYIVELAQRFIAEPQWEQLAGTDEQIVERLCGLRGVGRWTAEYGAMVGLGLVDTLPAADIGLMRMVQRVYGLPSRPNEEQVREVGEGWSPWRGLVTFYLWHQEDAAAATATQN